MSDMAIGKQRFPTRPCTRPSAANPLSWQVTGLAALTYTYQTNWFLGGANGFLAVLGYVLGCSSRVPDM